MPLLELRIAITGAAGMLGGRFSRRASSDPDQNGFGKKATTVDRAAGEILD